MPPEMSDQDGNRRGPAFAMVDKRCVHGPVNAQDRPCCQIRVKFGPFAYKCQTVAIFYELLNLSGMRSATEIPDANPYS